MGVKPEEILQVAERLFQQANNAEGMFRSSASRAYYAVFHLMGQDLNLSGYERGVAVHRNLLDEIGALDPAYVSDRQKLARRWFATLKDVRVKADYYVSEGFPRNDAALALQRAKDIFAADSS